MKNSKKILALLLALVLVFSLAACAKDAAKTGADTQKTETAANGQTEKTNEQKTDDKSSEGETEPEKTDEPASDPILVRIGSLKGPTTMGIVNLMKAAENGECYDTYDFAMATDASEIAAGLVQNTYDIALIPANLAAVLYNKKTDKGITVIDVNTMGVLYCVTGDESIHSVKDLAGKTVYLTGQGTTPEYTLRYLLDKNGVADCKLEFKSEASEVAAVLANDAAAIGVLPQPFATVAQVQNEALKEAFYLSDEWDAVSNDSRFITGVTVVRNAFLEENPEAVARFLEAHAASAEKANADVDGTAELVAEYGIIEKAPVAKKALPKCGITCLTGEEMKAAVMGYLKVLFEADPASVGGAMPEDSFCLAG